RRPGEERTEGEGALLRQGGALPERRIVEPDRAVLSETVAVPDPDPDHGAATGRVVQGGALLREHADRPVARPGDQHADAEPGVRDRDRREERVRLERRTVGRAGLCPAPSTVRPNAPRAGSRRRSPAPATPPPTTTSAGSNTFTRPAMPTPRRRPASTTMPRATASPSRAASTTICPVTASGS